MQAGIILPIYKARPPEIAPGGLAVFCLSYCSSEEGEVDAVAERMCFL